MPQYTVKFTYEVNGEKGDMDYRYMYGDDAADAFKRVLDWLRAKYDVRILDSCVTEEPPPG